MRLTKRGAVWRVEFTDLHGKRVRLSTEETDEQRAKLKALDIMREHLLDTVPLSERHELARCATLDHALQRCYDERWKAQRQGKPLAYRVGALQREVGHWRLPEVTYARLDGYAKQRLASGDAPATVNRKLSAIHTAMTEAVKRGELPGLPMFPHMREAAVKERYLSDAEERAVLEWIKVRALRDAYTPGTDQTWAYMRWLVPFLLDTGLRLSEALSLTEGHFTGTAVVLRHGTTKSGKGRQVPLTQRAQDCLRSMLQCPLHGKVDPNWCGRRWRTVTEALGMGDVTLHTLRHTCASRLVQRGLDLYRVQAWLGHSSATITERYAHLAPDHLTEGAALLEPSVPVLAE